MADQQIAKEITPAGVTVSIDDNAMLVRVSVPGALKLPRSFIGACHEQAGELGYGIEFVGA